MPENEGMSRDRGPQSEAPKPTKRPWMPDLMTEDELIEYLRIPEISAAENHHHVIENLKRMHDLPRMHLCNKVLFPRKAIDQWIEGRVEE